MAVVAALESVDLVTWFDEDTPLSLIWPAARRCSPRAGTGNPEAIVGARDVQAWGGNVRSIPFEHQRSTTALLRKIRGK
jgi:bifunctional ADP-heptose synthase (sugar kinase/adenylyltransferase)